MATDEARKDEIAKRHARIYFGLREGHADTPMVPSLVVRINKALTDYEGPSGEGWQQRIAAMDPWRRETFTSSRFGSPFDGAVCIFCEAEARYADSPREHKPD